MNMTKNKKKSMKPIKPYWEMNTEELRDATKEFNGPINESEWRPMTKSERAKFEGLQKGPHRSVFIHRPEATRLHKSKRPSLSKSTRARVATSDKNGTSHSRLPVPEAARLFSGLTPRIISRIEKYAAEHEMSPQEFVVKSLESSLTFVGG